MRFVRFLFLAIRLCQCSGLCPISVSGSKTNSTIKSKKLRFASLTATLLIVYSILFIHTFAHFEWFDSKILLFTNLCVFITIRLHAGVVLIESYANRSIQFKLLEKFDEIELNSDGKSEINPNDKRLRQRFRKFVIIWMVAFIVFNLIAVVGGLLTSEWNLLYEFVVLAAPLYTSTLFYTQLMVYLDVIKYKIEAINDCLAKLKDSPRIYWLRRSQKPIESNDICQRLNHLRRCYCKTWEASVLLNRSFRWSFLIGINNDFILYIVNAYWIVYTLLHWTSAKNVMLLTKISWAVVNMYPLLVLPLICEQIMEQVCLVK